MNFLYIILLVVPIGIHGARLRMLETTVLGEDPSTVNHLNGESFQQDALTTSNGYQYAAFWTTSSQNATVRHATLARRKLNIQSAHWEKFTFTDYNQTQDDGHDIISIGISPSDGVMHMAFDQHDNDLHYRYSKPHTTTLPANVSWSPSLFGPIVSHLHGPAGSLAKEHYVNVTYPRFLNIPALAKNGDNVDLMFEYRVGRSGLGDSWMYEYTPFIGWSLIGKYLTGIQNNPYINGLDFSLVDGTLHASWTYRDYVDDGGSTVAVQAGANGPENNHDLVYAYSENRGRTWRNTWGQQVADITGRNESILPTAPGITVFSIPKYGGILNQEAQTVDAEGRFHVLNRENTTGTERWYHYWRSTTHDWTRTALPLPPDLRFTTNVTATPTVIGKRGKLFPVGASDGVQLLAILPSNTPGSSGLSILASTASGHFRDWALVFEMPEGCDWEPLFDRTRHDILSLYLTDRGSVKVLDLDLTDLTM